MLTAILSLIAGFLSVLAPCVLPLLPIIIGGSFTGVENKKRPYIIVGSLVFSLVLFTLLLKASTALIGINPNIWSYISGGIVVLLGLTMLFPRAWDEFIGRLGLQAKSQKLLGDAGRAKSGSASAILTGLALGPVFSSCSPMYAWVIATVLPESNAKGLFYLGMYSIGLAIALLGIALLGRKMIDKIKWASNPHGWFQRIIAILFILVGIAVATGYDKKIQTYLVDKDILNIKTLEEKLIPDDEDAAPQDVKNTNKSDAPYFNVNPYTAPELVGLEEWLNSDPLTLASLRGKVVLIDFWTYSCINCVRTIPYVQGWYEKYKDDGFIVLGLHAPEFAFEKILNNVRTAVSDRGITYPVALDNNFTTWRAYQNQFWPAHYLIDKDGQIRRTHFGEGEYVETEQAIRDLLVESGASEFDEIENAEEKLFVSRNQTPETYIGADRADSNTNSRFIPGVQSYVLDPNQAINSWSLGGQWDISDEKGTCVRECSLQLRYRAKDVYAVFSGKGSATINGKQIIIDTDDIHPLVKGDIQQEATFELKLSDGLSIHAFTFGS